jgi:DNA-binding transcriptional regulator YiaG
MPSFMMEIEAAMRSPLDQLAVDYFTTRSGQPSISFCRQTLGVPEDDQAIARRLGVAVSTVRGWRDLGRRSVPIRRDCR